MYQFDKATKCEICKGAFKNPKVLPCRHEFCQQCLEQLITISKFHLTCPTCSMNHNLTPNGVNDFPNAIQTGAYQQPGFTPYGFAPPTGTGQYPPADPNPVSLSYSTYAPSVPGGGFAAPVMVTGTYQPPPMYNQQTVPPPNALPFNPAQGNYASPPSYEQVIRPQPSVWTSFQPVQQAPIQQNQMSVPAQQMTGNAWTQTSGTSIPISALEGGRDSDGSILYIGRANHGGSLVPGKVQSQHGKCYVPFGGKEYGKSSYEIYVGTGYWVPATQSNIPPNAVIAGKSENGEPLYVGRAQYNGSLTVGKVQKSHGCCYIPYGGKENKVSNFEVLVA